MGSEMCIRDRVTRGSRDPILEFGHPSISGERYKLVTRNLARRWTVHLRAKFRVTSLYRSPDMEGCPKFQIGSHDPLVTSIDLIFHFSRTPRGTNGKNEKLGQRGSPWGHMTQFLPRCNVCNAVFLIAKVSVCLSVCLSVLPSVRLSVTRVNCDKTNESSAEILIPYER